MSRRLSLADAALGCVLPPHLLRMLDRVCKFYGVHRSEIVRDVVTVFLTQLGPDQVYRFAPVSNDTSGRAKEQPANVAKPAKTHPAPTSGGRRHPRHRRNVNPPLAR